MLNIPLNTWEKVQNVGVKKQSVFNDSFENDLNSIFMQLVCLFLVFSLSSDFTDVKFCHNKKVSELKLVRRIRQFALLSKLPAGVLGCSFEVLPLITSYEHQRNHDGRWHQSRQTI